MYHKSLLPRDSGRPGCAECPVRALAACASLDCAALEAFARLGRRETLRRGETLLWEGERSVVVATVRSGLLMRAVSLGDGREQMLGLVFPGDFVGRPFADRSDHSVTAVADAELCVFPRERFEVFAREHPGFEHALYAQTLDELARARQAMVMFARMSAGERVAGLLAELMERGGAGVDGRIAIPLSRQQIADLLGLTIETVSRKLRAFERAGLVELPDYRTFRVPEPEALRRMGAGA